MFEAKRKWRGTAVETAFDPKRTTPLKSVLARRLARWYHCTPSKRLSHAYPQFCSAAASPTWPQAMKWLAIFSAALIAVIALYAIAYPGVPIRYRLTLEAEVDGKPINGSGVIEVTYRKQMSIGAVGRDVDARFRGEAVVLDLGRRGALFVLLKAGASDDRSGPASIVLKAFGLGGVFPGWDPESLKKVRTISGTRELPLDSLPLTVRFRDVNDPMTLELVNPFNIAERFGAGARLVQATIEIVPAGIWPFNSLGITGEPITTGIDRKLVWLNHLDKYNSVPGNPFTNKLPSEISGLRDPWHN